MTVNTTLAAISYVGNGAQTTFSIPFEAVDKPSIHVFVDDVLQTIGYSVTGNVTQPGAAVQFTTAPASGAAVDILRETSLTQDTVYTAYGQYKAKQVEADFDKLMLIAQELEYQILHPPPIVFPPTPTAAQISFAPAGGISSTNVQAALQEADVEWRAADALQVPKATLITSADTDTLAITNPTLAQDVVLSTRTNIPLGLLKLDESGKVPAELLQATGLTFKGVWGPVTDGATPPGSGTQGDYFLFDEAGNMTLRESANSTPHTVAVLVGDEMVYDANAVAGWYFIHTAQLLTVTAAAVSFVPTGTLVSSNVQAAIAELDGDISDRFHESGFEVVIERFTGIAKEPIFRSNADGVRLLRQSKDRLGTTQFGVDVWGDIPNSNPNQATRINLLSSDGVPQAFFEVGAALALTATRQGTPVSISVTGAAGVQAVLTGTPDGEAWLDYAGAHRVGAVVDGLTISGADPDANLTQRSLLTYLSADGVRQARAGFNATSSFIFSIDRANAEFLLQLASGVLFQLTSTFAAFTGIATLSASGQVTAGAAAPTAANHLTRKDYVDTRLTGFSSANTAITGNFAVPHNLGVKPSEFSAYLVNAGTQYGYVPNDEIPLPRTAAVGGTFAGFDVGADATNIWFTTTGVMPWITPKAGGVPSQITASFWRVRLFARR